MRKRNILHRAALAVLCLIIVFSQAAIIAAPYDESASSTLSVEFQPNDSPAAKVKFRVYRVADVSALGEFTLFGDFEDCDVSFTGLDNAGWTKAAKTLFDYMRKKRISPLSEAPTDKTGIAVFSGMENGLYLVEGNSYTSGRHTYKPTPFLVSLPNLADDGSWEYSVTSTTKYTDDYSETHKTYASLEVVKKWKGDVPSDRPKEITVDLFYKGTHNRTVTLDSSNGWTYTDNRISASLVNEEWSVEEVKVDGYVMEDVDVSVKGNVVTVAITNSKEPDEPDDGHGVLKVIKKWNGGSSADRPERITVELFNKGVHNRTVTLHRANNWTYTDSRISESLVNKDWTVGEVKVDGYVLENVGVTVSGNTVTITITNKKDNPPDEPHDSDSSLKVVKVWKDDSSADRPKEITADLYHSGVFNRTVTLNSANDWTYTAAIDKSLLNVDWTVGEVKVDGYVLKNINVSLDGNTVVITITNKKDNPPGEPHDSDSSLKVVKIWKDDSSADRPKEVTVDLYYNGVFNRTVTLNSANDWTYADSIDNSTLNANWTANEVKVDGYVTKDVDVDVSGNTVTVSVTNSKDKPDEPDEPDEPEEPEEPEEPKEPKEPNEPIEPEEPEEPVIPGNPETPEIPEIPEIPETPENPKTPEEPEEPKLPQTGTLWWPVPVLYVLGVGMIAAGSYIRKEKNASDKK